MEPELIQEVGQALVQLWPTAAGQITAFVALATLFYKVSRPLRVKLRVLFQMWERLGLLLPKLEQTIKEVLPNGGSSISDAVHRLEAQVHLSAERQWVVLADHEHGYFEADPDGKYVRVNRRWSDLTELSPEDTLGEGWVLGVVEEDRDRVLTAWTRAIEQKRGFSLSFRVGTGLHVKGTCMPVRDSRGQVIAYIGKLVESQPSIDHPED